MQACGCPPPPRPPAAGPAEVAAGTAQRLPPLLLQDQAMKAAATSGCQTTSQSLWTEEHGLLLTTSESDKWPHADWKGLSPENRGGARSHTTTQITTKNCAFLTTLCEVRLLLSPFFSQRRGKNIGFKEKLNTILKLQQRQELASSAGPTFHTQKTPSPLALAWL